MADDNGGSFDAVTWACAYIFSVLPAISYAVLSFQQGETLQATSAAAFSFGSAAGAAIFAMAAWRWITRNFGWNSLTTYLLVACVAGFSSPSPLPASASLSVRLHSLVVRKLL